MPTPEIPLFSPDPLTAAGLTVLLAQAGAYSLYWFLGDRAHRERAMEGFERVLTSGVLFGIALILVNLSLWGLNTYLSIANIEPPPGGAISILSQTKGWQDFANNIQAALRVAEQTYKSFVSESFVVLGAYAGAVIATGVVPWTSPISMAIMNVYAFLVTAVTTVLLSAGVYAAAAAMAHAWPLLLPLGAVLTTYERTRNLGAWLLALSVVAPVVLAAGADVVRSAVMPGQIAALAGMVTPFFAFSFPHVDALLKAMIMLGLIGLVLTVMAYAVSRIFDHAGAHLAID